MPSVRDAASRGRIADMLAAGVSHRSIARQLRVGKDTIAAVKHGGVDGRRCDLEAARKEPRAVRYDDKRVPSATYEDFIKNARINQAFKRSVGWGQRRVGIDLRERTEPALILGLSDLHAGSWGSDLETLDRFTRFVKAQNGRVLVALVGDLLNLAIKLRGVLEVKDDMWPPEMQHEFIALWLEEMAPFILCAGWGNHDVEREESGSGASLLKYVMGRAVPWFDGIGRCDVHLGGEIYRMAISHRFRGSGNVNVTRGQHQFMKEQMQDVELAIAGDFHQPAIQELHYGEHHRVAINLGSLQLNSGFAQRYFAPRTEPIFPCVEIYPDRHMMNPYWSVNHWLQAKGMPLEQLEPAQYVDYSVA